MKTYLINICYKGTHYQGWQKQPHSTMTVQGQLNDALKRITKSEDVHTLASGRTDSGVHALNQIVRVQIPLDIDPENLVKAINTKLPEDIRVLKAELTTSDFHPLAKAKKKEYRYYFSNDDSNPHLSEQVTFIRGNLDIETMENGISHFIGKKDFLNYFCVGTDTETTVREIFNAHIKKLEIDFPVKSTIYVATFVGDGFLKQMVRLMMGALFELGKGKFSVSQIENSFGVKLPRHLGPVAPPEGLFLHSVSY